MNKNTQHVVKDPKGGWVVKKGGALRATKHFDTQKDAERFGKKIAKNQSAELYVHGKDGKIKRKSSFGNDPFPPRDKK